MHADDSGSDRADLADRYVVCAADELAPGTRRIVTVGSRSIGVFNVGGRYYALRNVCPHQGAPLCQGTLTGTTLPGPPGTFRYGKEGRILRCPWHGWEFDVTDGRSIFNPRAVRVRAYPVGVEATAPHPDEVRVETCPVRVERKMVVLRGVGASRQGTGPDKRAGGHWYGGSGSAGSAGALDRPPGACNGGCAELSPRRPTESGGLQS